MGRAFTYGSNATYLRVADGGTIDITGTALTLSYWISMTGDSQLSSAIIMKGAGLDHTAANTQMQYGAFVAAYAYLYHFIGDAAGQDGGTVTSLNALKGTGWHHLCMRKSPGALDSFLDGSLIKTVGSNKSIQNTASPLYIAHGNGGEGSFGGQIGHVALWNAALTNGEIQALYQRAPVASIRKQNLAAYWPMFNGGLVTTEPDWSGNKQHATEVGTVMDSSSQPPVGLIARS